MTPYVPERCCCWHQAQQGAGDTAPVAASCAAGTLPAASRWMQPARPACCLLLLGHGGAHFVPIKSASLSSRCCNRLPFPSGLTLSARDGLLCKREVGWCTVWASTVSGGGTIFSFRLVGRRQTAGRAGHHCQALAPPRARNPRWQQLLAGSMHVQQLYPARLFGGPAGSWAHGSCVRSSWPCQLWCSLPQRRAAWACPLYSNSFATCRDERKGGLRGPPGCKAGQAPGGRWAGTVEGRAPRLHRGRWQDVQLQQALPALQGRCLQLRCGGRTAMAGWRQAAAVARPLLPRRAWEPCCCVEACFQTGSYLQVPSG